MAIEVWVIHSKIRGVTQKNQDGTDRQALINEFVREGQILALRREKDNPYGENAIAVHLGPRRGSGADRSDQIGYIGQELANDLAGIMDRGDLVTCVVTDTTGGTHDKAIGVNIMLVVHKLRVVVQHAKQWQDSIPEPKPGKQHAAKTPAILEHPKADALAPSTSPGAPAIQPPVRDQPVRTSAQPKSNILDKQNNAILGIVAVTVVISACIACCAIATSLIVLTR